VFVPEEFAMTTGKSHGPAGLAEPEVRHTDACHSQGAQEPTGSTPKLAHVRQPRTMVVNPG
jgi:hypothetical protein